MRVWAQVLFIFLYTGLLCHLRSVLVRVPTARPKASCSCGSCSLQDHQWAYFLQCIKCFGNGWQMVSRLHVTFLVEVSWFRSWHVSHFFVGCHILGGVSRFCVCASNSIHESVRGCHVSWKCVKFLIEMSRFRSWNMSRFSVGCHAFWLGVTLLCLEYCILTKRFLWTARSLSSVILLLFQHRN